MRSGPPGRSWWGSCLEELERRDGRYGVAAVSGAAGLGVAVVMERLAF
jgi:acetyl-CoA C-acetyltransferase